MVGREKYQEIKDTFRGDPVISPRGKEGRCKELSRVRTGAYRWPVMTEGRRLKG